MKAWADSLRALLHDTAGGPVVILGIGNPVKRDDSVGLYIASRLRRRLGSSPSKHLRIHAPVGHPELAISKIDLASTRLLLVDAVEAGKPPGSIIFAKLNESKYGFFVTHNVPLRMHPSVQEHPENVFVLGIQPEDVGVGEGLSGTVSPAAEKVVEVAAGSEGGD